MKMISAAFTLVFCAAVCAAEAAPVLTEKFLSGEVWSFSEYKSMATMRFENGSFDSDVPMSGDHCAGGYQIEDNTLYMSIRSENMGFLPAGEKKGEVELVLRDMPSVFHPCALVDKKSGKPRFWPANVFTPNGKEGCRYEGVEMVAVQRRGFVKGDSVFLRSAPSLSATPYFCRLLETSESDNPRPVVTKRFLMKGQLLAVVGRTKDRRTVGNSSDYWYLVIPFMHPKSADADLEFGMSADEKGAFYPNKPVWMFGKFVEVTKDSAADLLGWKRGY